MSTHERAPEERGVGGFLAAVVVSSVLGLAILAGTDFRGVAVGFVDAIARVSFWGLVLLACARLGARMVGSRLTGLAHLVWDGTTGLAALIATLLAIGLIPGGFRATTVRVVLAVVVTLATLVARADPVARLRAADRPDAPTLALAVGLITLAVVGLAWDRVPTLFFDSRSYHFAQPELWLVTGRIAPETWSLHSWFPPGMSVLYGVGLATGGEAWANDANLLAGACLVAAAFDLGRRLVCATTGLVASAILLALPLTLHALAIPAADLGHGAFVFGSLSCLLLARSTDDSSWLERASLLAAGAILTKYLGMIVPLVLGAVAVGMWPPAAPARAARRVLRFAGPALLLALPWFAANAVRTGNPFAPVATALFATSGLAPGGAERFREDARGGPPGWVDVRNLGPRWFTGNDEESPIYPTPALGWMPLLLAPLALVAVRHDRNVRMALGASILLLLIWFVTFRWERFLVAAAALGSVALAGGVVVTWRRGGALRVLAVAGLVAGLASIAPTLAGIERFTGGLRVACGLDRASELIDYALPIARLSRRANERLDPRTDRLLFLGEQRHYGLSLPRCAPTGFNTHPLVEALRAAPDSDAVHRELRRQRFTHLVVDPGWIVRSGARYPALGYFAEHPDVVSRYVGSLGTPLLSEGGVSLFEIPE